MQALAVGLHMYIAKSKTRQIRNVKADVERHLYKPEGHPKDGVPGGRSQAEDSGQSRNYWPTEFQSHSGRPVTGHTKDIADKAVAKATALTFNLGNLDPNAGLPSFRLAYSIVLTHQSG